MNSCSKELKRSRPTVCMLGTDFEGGALAPQVSFGCATGILYLSDACLIDNLFSLTLLESRSSNKTGPHYLTMDVQ